ncbi:MAG: beta-lactamase family protein [Rhizobiales bacterium]|nr:beta-lactamase family protein [Hyphomicrobiales bacterium]
MTGHWPAAAAGSRLSKSELTQIADAMRGHVERGEVPGMVTLLSHGNEVHVEALGVKDLQSPEPMRRDTIFRIASMTKPVTAAAAMLLVEEGKLGLDDPVDKFLPELAGRKVLRSLESPLDDTVPAARAITLRDLLTFRMGIGAVMVFPAKYPIQHAMEEAGVAPGPNLFPGAPDEFMKRLGGLPLVHQPGEVWMYHTGLDIAGVLLARAAGKSLGEFMAERIFVPLGMKDTGFYVPESKLDRLATAYQRDEAGKLVVWDKARGGKWASPPAFEAGGGGLVSTVDDFHAFARMMLNSGQHGSVRILSPESVEAMTTDQITPEQKAASPFYPGFWDNRGWGLGLSMTTGPDGISSEPGRYGWDGGYGTTYIADPGRDMVAILLMQRMMGGPDDFAINQEFLKLAYEAIKS